MRGTTVTRNTDWQPYRVYDGIVLPVAADEEEAGMAPPCFTKRRRELMLPNKTKAKRQRNRGAVAHEGAGEEQQQHERGPGVIPPPDRVETIPVDRLAKAPSDLSRLCLTFHSQNESKHQNSVDNFPA